MTDKEAPEMGDAATINPASEHDESPEMSPTRKAAQATQKDLMQFMEKKGSGNQNSLTDVTEHTTETLETVETEIWNAANKIIEDKLQEERAEDRRKLDRTIDRFKQKKEKLKAELRKSQQEKIRIARERDSLKKALEEEKKNGEKTLSVHRRALERNDRMQTSAETLRQRIEKLEQERYTWVDERSKLMITLVDLQAQVQREKKNKKSPARTLESIPEDGSRKDSKGASSGESLQEDQQKTREAILASQLEEVRTSYEFERKLLKKKNEELSNMEKSNKSLSDNMKVLSDKMKASEKMVEDMKKDSQRAKDSRRSMLEENKSLRHEVRRLQDTIGSISEQVALQQNFVKNVKANIQEGKEMHQKQMDALLNVCREFEDSCKKISKLQVGATKPPRHTSKRTKDSRRTADKKKSTSEKVASKDRKIQQNEESSKKQVAVENN